MAKALQQPGRRGNGRSEQQTEAQKMLQLPSNAPSNALSNAQQRSHFSRPPKARLHHSTPCNQRGQVTEGHVRWLVRDNEARCFQSPPLADRAANCPRGRLHSRNAVLRVTKANTFLVSRNKRQHSAPCSSAVLILPDIYNGLSRKEEEKPYVFLHA